MAYPAPHSCDICTLLVVDPAAAVLPDEVRARCCTCTYCGAWLEGMLQVHDHTFFQIFDRRLAIQGRKEECPLLLRLTMGWPKRFVDQLVDPAQELQVTDLVLCFGCSSDGGMANVTRAHFRRVHVIGVIEQLTIAGDTAWTNSWAVAAEEESPASAFVRLRPVARYLGDPAIHTLARSLMRSCDETHDQCNEWVSVAAGSRFTPTMLIDVSGEGEEVLLVTPGSDSAPVTSPTRYAALSYCWGGDQTQKTLRMNVERRRRQLSALDLPRTIREAIEVTRRLGIPYLWVDSLCIIQDDPEDVERELGNMHLIYECAYLLISATTARSCHDGLFVETSMLDDNQIPYRCPDGEMGWIRLQLAHQRPDLDQPLHKRAWTMQEHVLSSRVLAFCRSGVRWSCRTAMASDGPWRRRDLLLDASEDAEAIGESGTWIAIQALTRQRQREQEERRTMSSEISSLPVPIQVDLGVMEQLNVIRIGPDSSPIGTRDLDYGPDYAGAVAEWRRLLWTFAIRDITNVTDRLPAISAIATKFATIFPGRYVAGLWEAMLPRELLWQVEYRYHFRRDQGSPFPSWTWASVNCGMIWQDLPDAVATVELLTVKVELQSLLAPFGHVKSAALLLRGHLVPMRTRELADDDGHHPAFPKLFVDMPSNTSVCLVPFSSSSDRSSPVRAGSPASNQSDADMHEGLIGACFDDDQLSAATVPICFCLELLRRDSAGYRRRLLPSAGLILVPQDDAGVVFSRVGVFYMGLGHDEHAGDWHIPDGDGQGVDAIDLPGPTNLFASWPMREIELV